MDIVIIAFVLIFIFSIKKCEMSCNLSKENTTIYKGFFTICVILGHLSQILGGGYYYKDILGNTIIGTSGAYILFLFRVWDDLLIT